MLSRPTRPLLLLGGNGMLGTAWRRLLTMRGRPHEAVRRPALDLRDPRSIDRVLTGAFSGVINCAGWTDVDGAEASERAAWLVNGEAVGHLAARCALLDVPLVHYSTDYIFDGHSRTSPWPVDGARQPLNAYGRTKLAGEVALEASAASYLLIRTSWLYAPWGKNFVRTIRSRLLEGKELSVVDDQIGSPSGAEHLAAVSLHLLDEGCAGVFHVTDSGSCTWYELAREVALLLGREEQLRRCSTADFPTVARRPRYSVLDTSQTLLQTESLQDWRIGVRGAVERMSELTQPYGIIEG